MRMKILLFLVVGIIPVSSPSQDLVFPDLAGYKLKTNYPVYLPENLWDFINGAADAYLSYDFVDLHVAEYKKGKNVIKLEIYRHSDNIMAFGIYSSERSPGFRFVNLGGQGYIADGAINFFKGNYYVKIRTYSKKAKVHQAAESLAAIVAGSLDGESTMPSLLSLFPGEGKMPNEESFINESVLGHRFLSKAFRAVYQVGPDNFTIYIIQNSSPEANRKAIETYVASTGIDAVDTGDGRYMIRDGYNGTIFIGGKNDKMVIISGLARDQADLADKYASRILE